MCWYAYKNVLGHIQKRTGTRTKKYRDAYRKDKAED